MQAPKNGFFYVLDRANGELHLGEHLRQRQLGHGDRPEDRPAVETPAARYQPACESVCPGPAGAHNWHPMAFNPRTGLVYIPARSTRWNHGATPEYDPPAGANGTPASTSRLGVATFPTPCANRRWVSCLAWDPVAQKERWRASYEFMWNGGTLTTAGNLVFQGTADGRFIAYQADTGAKALGDGGRQPNQRRTGDLRARWHAVRCDPRRPRRQRGRHHARRLRRRRSGEVPCEPKLFIFGLDGARSVEALKPAS